MYYAFRKPKTANELRQNADPEIAEYVRGRRNKNNIVTAWDDIPNGKNCKYDDSKKIHRSRNNFRKTIRGYHG